MGKYRGNEKLAKLMGATGTVNPHCKTCVLFKEKYCKGTTKVTKSVPNCERFEDFIYESRVYAARGKK